MRVELMDTTGTLLRETQMTEITRDIIALTYAMALCSSDKTDWRTVNLAIIDKWSISALEYIKTRAWKLVEEKKAKK